MTVLAADAPALDPSPYGAASLAEAIPVHLAGLDGVSEVRVTSDRRLDVHAVRLHLLPTADEASVAMAAGRALRDRLGLVVDADTVELAELVRDPAPGVARLEVARAGASVTATVVLAGPQTMEANGAATRPATKRGVLQAVAEAALSALAVPGGEAWQLVSLDVGRAGGAKAVRVSVAPHDSGAAPDRTRTATERIGQDLRQAVLRAVLQLAGAVEAPPDADSPSAVAH